MSVAENGSCYLACSTDCWEEFLTFIRAQCRKDRADPSARIREMIASVRSLEALFEGSPPPEIAQNVHFETAITLLLNHGREIPTTTDGLIAEAVKLVQEHERMIDGDRPLGDTRRGARVGTVLRAAQDIVNAQDGKDRMAGQSGAGSQSGREPSYPMGRPPKDVPEQAKIGKLREIAYKHGINLQGADEERGCLLILLEAFGYADVSSRDRVHAARLTTEPVRARAPAPNPLAQTPGVRRPNRPPMDQEVRLHRQVVFL